ncbi:MAG: glutaredoxin family protein [Candidatus Aminicenantaceae bacterium]
MSLQITFYTKPNCPLCEEAEELLEELKDLFGFSIFKVNIIKNMSTYEKYKNQIPVIDLGGRYYLSGKIDKKELKQKIRALVKK